MSKQTKMPKGFSDKESKLRKGQMPEKMCYIEYKPGKFMKAFRKPIKNKSTGLTGNPSPMRMILKDEPYATGTF